MFLHNAFEAFGDIAGKRLDPDLGAAGVHVEHHEFGGRQHVAGLAAVHGVEHLHALVVDGEYLGGFGEAGDGDGQLNMPWGIAIDDEGNVFVADWRNDRVQKFSRNGEFILKIGESGSGKGEFDRPSSVAVDAHGDIYVCDWGNDRVQLFSPEGRFVEQFIGDANMSRSGREYILANQRTLRLREMADLEDARRLRAPTMIKVDDLFRLFIADFASHRIQVYKKEAYVLSETEISPPLRNPVLLTA